MDTLLTDNERIKAPTCQADEVMHFPELLETILVNLPTRDLLFASRICKTWKSTIDSSPRIQRALFLKPGNIEDVDRTSIRHDYRDHTHASKQSVAVNPPLIAADGAKSLLAHASLVVDADSVDRIVHAHVLYAATDSYQGQIFHLADVRRTQRRTGPAQLLED
ncbi:hypothetical protein LTR56_025461 [Elasticomyces elasticus]|nr:hypothetical protein LTR56_025461 [Elasticomyces elasticus]KAK3620694.1 hypothetical protein LTR22_025497 [Elasticomyces elasticus]KAK4924823.1 hypothetical protein LTR49_008044 [Elasticomyces elasticus]KAK5740302.1 hypothetical protein LTS12_025000 [Elasticomyces elasticus]